MTRKADRPKGTYGELDEALRWSCGFGEHETDPPCMDPAVWHGIILDDARINIVAVMSCCEEHVRFMRRHATYVHEMGSACLLPGSKFWWPENFCSMPDEGLDRLATEAVAVPQVVR